jgi:putative sterol carrier protein
MNISELFAKLQEKAARVSLDPDLTALVAFDISGAEPAQWHGRVAGGKAVLYDGPTEGAEITVSAKSEVAIGVYEKTINPVMAFMTGKIKVRGDSAKIGLIKSLLTGK